MQRWLVLVLVLLLSACGVGGSDLSGSYVGSVVDTVGGSGQGTITLAQSGNQLGGSWQISFSSLSNRGSLQGVVSGSSVSPQLYPSRPDACPYTLTATRNGDTLRGNYSAFNCTAPLSGTFTGTRQ